MTTDISKQALMVLKAHMDYVFYDTETTGISPYYDQILQFAAIRTDENFKELERFEIRCQIQPHIVANPGAMKVTRVTAADLTNPGFATHYEMMKTIREKLISWQPAIFIGQNTIAFDEPMLRSDFYQNLFPTYLTNTNGNKRMDSLPIMHALSVLAPDVLDFPINPKGNKSFKLDLVAPANGHDHSNAHEAVSDVEATIFICERMKSRAPKVWENFRKHADKYKVLNLTQQCRPYGLIRSFFGKVNISLVSTLGVSPQNSNEVLSLNLIYDPDELDQMSDEEIIKTFKKSPRPILNLRANAMPSIWSLDDFPQITEHAAIDDDVILHRAKRLEEIAGFKQRVLALYFEAGEDFEESPFVERQIYSGFPSRGDERLMSEFHKLPWNKRWDMVQSLEDARFREMGERLIFFNAPESMPVQRRQHWENYLEERLASTSPETEWLTLPKAIVQTNQMLEKYEGSEREILEGHLSQYITQLSTFS